MVQPWHADDDFVIWIGTSPTSRKVAELAHDPRASLVYPLDSHGACVVLKGTVARVEDDATRRRRFMPFWSAFFPKGPLHDFVALRFEPHAMEVIDFRAAITPSPFGLCAVKLVREGARWAADDGAAHAAEAGASGWRARADASVDSSSRTLAARRGNHASAASISTANVLMQRCVCSQSARRARRHGRVEASR